MQLKQLLTVGFYPGCFIDVLSFAGVNVRVHNNNVLFDELVLWIGPVVLFQHVVITACVTPEYAPV